MGIIGNSENRWKRSKRYDAMIAIVVVIMILLIGYAFLGIVEMGKKRNI